MKTVELYKYNYFWRRGDHDADYSPQDRDDGTGDLLWNTLTKIVYDNDTSDWAIQSYLKCSKLLKKGQRWSREFNSKIEAPNRWIWYPYRALMKLFKVPSAVWKWTRPETDMTRDPYYAQGQCLFHFLKHKPDMPNEMMADLVESFIAVKLPWYLFRFNYITWRKRLIKSTSKLYVKRIRKVKEQSYVWCYQVKCKLDIDSFYKDTP